MPERRRHVDQKTRDVQMEHEGSESSIGRREELAKQNVQLEEIREIGRSLVVQRFKGNKRNLVLNTGFDRMPCTCAKEAWRNPSHHNHSARRVYTPDFLFSAMAEAMFFFESSLPVYVISQDTCTVFSKQACL